MGIRTGQQFLEGLKDSREIWLEGSRVDDVTTDPKLGRMAKTLAGLFATSRKFRETFRRIEQTCFRPCRGGGRWLRPQPFLS